MERDLQTRTVCSRFVAYSVTAREREHIGLHTVALSRRLLIKNEFSPAEKSCSKNHVSRRSFSFDAAAEVTHREFVL